MRKRLSQTGTLGVLAGACLASGAASGAYYFEATTTSEGAGLGRNGQTSSVQAWIDGASAKVVFEERDASGMFAAGSYLLTMDGGETVYLVNPEERTIAEIDLAQIFQMVGSLAEASGGLVDMEFADYTSEKLLEEPGEQILGYSTTHYRYRTGYTMRIRVLGFNRENRSENEQDFYCTDAIDASGFSVWLRPDRFRTGNESTDEMIRQQFADIDCVPLRTRTVTTMTGERGRDSTVTSTTEVTALREEPPPAGTFVLPDGYERVSLLPEIPIDQIAPQQGEAEQSESEGRRPRLRDLFNR
jgi:hypothetical protein